MELLYYVDVLHLLRIRRLHDSGDRTLNGFVLPRYEDILKYCAQCVATYGDVANTKPPRIELIQGLIKIAEHLHSLAEYHSLLPFAAAEISGEKRENARLEFDSQLVEQRGFVLEYFQRLEDDTAEQSKELRCLDDHLARFAAEFESCEDLFAEAAGIKLSEFIDVTKAVAGTMSNRLKAAEQEQAEIVEKSGPLAFRAILARVKCYVWRKEVFAGNPTLAAWLKFLSFDREGFSAEELWFDRSTKGPVFVAGDLVVVSVEALLDGLSTTARDVILRNATTRQRFKAAASQRFLERVTTAFIEAGYEELAEFREHQVYDEDGETLGDIDRAYTNGSRTILVEGKNHVLTPAEHAKDEPALLQRLARTEDWLTKVQARSDRIMEAPPDNFAEHWEYIIVTREPEILAHKATIPVVCIRELPTWLRQGRAFGEFLKQRFAEQARDLDLDQLSTITGMRWDPPSEG